MFGDRRHRPRRAVGGPTDRPRLPPRRPFREQLRERVRERVRDRVVERLPERALPRPAKRVRVESGRSPHQTSRERRQEPPPKLENEQSAKIYVGDLAEDVKKEELEEEFQKFGRLKEVWIAQHPPGFAFIDYHHADDAKAAVEALDGKHICGAKVRVELSKKRENKPIGAKRKKKKKRPRSAKAAEGNENGGKSASTKGSGSDPKSRSRSPNGNIRNLSKRKTERPGKFDKGPPRPVSRALPQKSLAVKARAAKALKRARTRAAGTDRPKPLAARLPRRGPSPTRKRLSSPPRHRMTGSPGDRVDDGQRRRRKRVRRQGLSPVPHRPRSPLRLPSPPPLSGRHTYSQSPPPQRSSRYDRFAPEREPFRESGSMPSYRRDRGEPFGRYSGAAFVNGQSTWERSRGRPPSPPPPPTYRSRSPARRRLSPLPPLPLMSQVMKSSGGRDSRSSRDYPLSSYGMPGRDRDYGITMPPPPTTMSSSSRYRNDMYRPRSPRGRSPPPLPPRGRSPPPISHRTWSPPAYSTRAPTPPMRRRSPIPHPRSPPVRYTSAWSTQRPRSPLQGTRSVIRRRSLSPMHKGMTHKSGRDRPSSHPVRSRDPPPRGRSPLQRTSHHSPLPHRRSPQGRSKWSPRRY